MLAPQWVPESHLKKFPPVEGENGENIVSQPSKSQFVCLCVFRVFKVNAGQLENDIRAAFALLIPPFQHPFDKAQKKPHGSFEVECGSCQHDVYGVSEKTLVKVPS
jgi:hypothetical protein